MRNRPSHIELLEAARSAMLETVMPGLADDLRVEALRVVQAIDIVSRELRHESAGADEVTARFATLYGENVADFEALEARLARDLRQGAFDQDGRARRVAMDILRLMTARKLAEDNPDYPR